MTNIKLLDLKQIRIDGGTQHRDIDPEIRNRYTELVLEEVELPPVEVMFDGKTYWLVDGFHRYQAHIAAECDCIQAVITRGSKRDAVWLSFSANKYHGFPRKPQDVFSIVQCIYEDKQWYHNQTHKQIAEHVGISERHVRRIIDKLESDIPITGPCPDIGIDVSTSALSGTKTEDVKISEPQPMKDHEGNDVPRKMINDFIRREQLDSWSKIMSGILNEIISLKSTNDTLIRHLPYERFKNDLENARNALKLCKPHAVCPYCGGEAKRCKACNGTGWITKPMYDAIPKELK